MSEKRRDNKKRILRNGESQRKDGRYAYTYIGHDGKQKFLYSWKLEPTDKLPAGKRECVALREQIKQLEKDMAQGIVSSDITLAELCELYYNQKHNIKITTKKNLQQYLKKVNQYPIATRKVKLINVAQGKQFVSTLFNEGVSYGYIELIKSLIKTILDTAIENKIIQTNPFNFKLNQILKKETQTKKPLTDVEEQRLLEMLKGDKNYKQYYNLCYILLNTGLRVSELCGLTEQDIDFDNMLLNVDKQLKKTTEGGEATYYLDTTKSVAGTRKIPFSAQTKEILNRVVQDANTHLYTLPELSNFSFLFGTKKGKPFNRHDVSNIFRIIQKKYNKRYQDETIFLTPHICRHTFCSKMVMRRINPKVLQYIMGHSSIEMTLNLYTHVTIENVCKEFADIIKPD